MSISRPVALTLVLASLPLTAPAESKRPAGGGRRLRDAQQRMTRLAS